MKKLISRHEKEKNQKRNQVVVGFALVLVMLFSVVGYAFQSGLNSGDDSDNQGTENSVTYKGVEFSQINGFWVAGGFSFSYNPQEIESFFPKVSNDLIGAASYQDVPLYIYSENTDAETEIRANLVRISSKVNDACIEGTECLGGLPLKTCNGEDRLIVIKEGTEGTVRQENNCVFIEGPKEDILALADGFLFKILEVI
ncbi:MAG: hypothetical protein KJ905_03645 [Nanoarchaeota archaeon]|nr:hypothetical protein [Nanoarchaeota archaeon]MBU1501834.1 hypothetical protein [Nanoarchaeota archaeon]